MNSPEAVAALIVKQTKLIRRQRLSVLLLLPALIATGLYARAEKQRADRWRTDALRLQSQQPQIEDSPRQSLLESTYYPTTLIGKDGSETPLDGQAVRIDLGDGKLLEVNLQRHPTNTLFMWAVARREDSYWHRVVFIPHCANAFSLGLLRVKSSSDTADNSDPQESVTYAAPR